jgi:hypothetical protein
MRWRTESRESAIVAGKRANVRRATVACTRLAVQERKTAAMNNNVDRQSPASALRSRGSCAYTYLGERTAKGALRGIPSAPIGARDSRLLLLAESSLPLHERW